MKEDIYKKIDGLMWELISYFIGKYPQEAVKVITEFVKKEKNHESK